MIPNTTGGQYPSSFTIPDHCSHGVGWAYPCASCGRPYSAPAEVLISVAPLVPVLTRIAVAFERIAKVAEDDKIERDEARRPR